ncbi:outer membrane protein assembly factor BamA [endosymbiont of Sipalinus gigas]|uniref:outer membrane protein assembly factor BamA n=1 Tax=endosymbiont of Sipalinus gigas TaxID=1972134 RepID=UPI000DC721EB|nr:outer membrane protein assembly factor BamA [endosymbiont of Sipalinus gigas]BBA85298.1 outer membrane protein assembly factor BamA [endosymbiont of Sipalinus gigas]
MLKKIINLVITYTFFSIANCESLFSLNKVYFEGLYRIPENVLVKYLNSYSKNNLISEKNIKNTIKDIYLTKYFSKVEFFIDNDKVLIRVKENPIISKIEFIGNKNLDSEIMEEMCIKADIKSGDPLNKFLLFKLKNKIIEYYNDIGKYNIIVNLDTKLDSMNRVNVRFLIDEGEYSRIRKINISGNKIFNNKTLLNKFKNHKKSIIKLLSKDVYKRKKFIEDLSNLSLFYIDNGYVGFKIESLFVKFNSNKLFIDIDLKLNEGIKYKVSNLLSESNVDNIKLDVILNYLSGIKKNFFYNKKKVSKIKNKIYKTVKKQNCINFDIKYKIDIIDKEKGELNIIFNIYSIDKKIVNNINIEGNNYTNEDFIRNSISQKEFSILNLNNIEKDISNLYKTDLFVDVDCNIIEDKNNNVTLLYKVNEDNDINGINIGLYISNLGVSLRNNFFKYNFLGTGSSIKLSSSINKKKISYDFFTKVPIIFKKNILNIYNDNFYNRICNEEKSSFFFIKNTGTKIGIGIPIFSNQEISFDYNSHFNEYEFNRVNNEKVLTFKDNLLVSEVKKGVLFLNNIYENYLDTLLSFNWRLDSTNRLYFPTKGKKINFNILSSFVPSKNKYYRILIKLRSVISNDLLGIRLSNLSQLMYFGNFLDGNKFPSYNNLNLSSLEEIRGFPIKEDILKLKILKFSSLFSDNVGKLEVSDDSFNKSKLYIVSKNELSLPLKFIISNKYIKRKVDLSFFVDLGLNMDMTGSKNILTKERDKIYKSFNFIRNLLYINKSFGISFKYILPFGPLSFSYSIPFKYSLNLNKENEITKFQINLGKKIW